MAHHPLEEGLRTQSLVSGVGKMRWRSGGSPTAKRHKGIENGKKLLTIHSFGNTDRGLSLGSGIQHRVMFVPSSRSHLQLTIFLPSPRQIRMCHIWGPRHMAESVAMIRAPSSGRGSGCQFPMSSAPPQVRVSEFLGKWSLPRTILWGSLARHRGDPSSNFPALYSSLPSQSRRPQTMTMWILDQRAVSRHQNRHAFEPSSI